MAGQKRRGSRSRVQPKTATSHRAPRKASPPKRIEPKSGAAPGPFDASPAMPTGVDPEKYPNLAALEAWDREMHIRSAIKMGLTRAQAERHVEEEIAGSGERAD